MIRQKNKNPALITGVRTNQTAQDFFNYNKIKTKKDDLLNVDARWDAIDTEGNAEEALKWMTEKGYLKEFDGKKMKILVVGGKQQIARAWLETVRIFQIMLTLHV